MAFSVHTFETLSDSSAEGFAFRESIGEGKEVFFLSKFSQDSTDARSSAEVIFGSIVDVLRTSKIKDEYDKFEDALKSANLEAKGLRSKISGQADIAVAYFDFNNLYFAQSGGAEAYMLRGDTLSQISEDFEESDKLFSNILNGQIAVDDVIMFSSSRMLRILTASQISDIFTGDNFEESTKTLRHKLTIKGKNDLLVTVIGVGISESSKGAGFLSKVVSKIAKPKSSVSDSEDEEGQTLVQDSALEGDLQASDEGGLFADSSKTEDEEDLSTKNADKTASEESVSILDEAPYSEGELFSRKNNILKQGFKILGKFRHNRHMMKITALIFIVLLVIIGIRIISNFESAATAALRQELVIARESLQQADAFLIQGDRVSAVEYLENAQKAVQKVLSSKSKNFRSDAQFLLADVQEKQLQVENAKKVVPQLLADLEIKNSDVEAKGILNLRGNLFGFDKNNLYKTIRNIVEKGQNISSKENIISASEVVDQNTLVFLTSGPRIIEYRSGIFSPMATSDTAWKNGIDLETYGRYIYVLDPVENQIWKYMRERSKYSGSTAYNTGADLSSAISIAIDGSIFIISSDGSIQKIHGGKKVQFAFRELPSVSFAGENLKLYTTRALDFLYLLDPDNSRVLVFSKGDQFATYKKQVIYDLPGIRDFTVDDSGQRINLISDTKIYEFNL